MINLYSTQIMDLPTELWFQVFIILTQKSQAKFSCLWNLYNLSPEEIQLLWSSDDLWFDCVKKGYIMLIQILIQNGTDVNIQDNDGDTALHSISFHGHKDCLEVLLKAGADVNIQNNCGNTALHKATINGHKDWVEVLLRAGADVNVLNNHGETALYFASIFGRKYCVEVLKK